MIITRTYANGHTRTFNVDSFVYDEPLAAAVITTIKQGDVAINSVDHPEMWEQFMAQKDL